MKKICYILTTLLLLVSFMTVYAGAFQEDDIEFPCGGVIEMVDVKILCSPLSSRISIGDYEPELEGIVILITYPDGEKEILTVEKKDGLYYAGNFIVSIWFSFNEKPEYGLVNKILDVSWYKDWGGYYSYTDFVYLYLPSFEEIPDIINSYFTK